MPRALSPRASGPLRVRLDPGAFADLSTGVALIKTYSCAGRLIGEGSGFLVGTKVLMTARHVVNGACRVRVSLDGSTLNAAHWTFWYSAHATTGAADVATIRLNAESDGHVFTIRSWSPGIGDKIATLGHPLGNGLSVTQGSIVAKRNYSGVPFLGVRILAAEGGSGSPLVDNNGNVVGILQIGLGSKDVLGQRTSGVILGIDLPSWWPNTRKGLCRAYPAGGIPGCVSSAPAPPPPDTTPTTTTPAPVPPPTTTTTPAPVPPPAPSWPPSGFTLWSGPGSYKTGTIAEQNASCSRQYNSSTTCWGVNIVASTGCRDNAFVKVDILDRNGYVVDTGIDETPPLAPGQVGHAQGDTFAVSPASYRITGIDCFDY